MSGRGGRRPRPSSGRERGDFTKRRRDDSKVDDDDDLSIGEDAGAEGLGTGFAAAMSKVMARTITGSAAVAPVMAKRHTAAQKLATKQKKEATEATVKRRARAASRLAHLLAPEEMPIENELKLKKLATKGGELHFQSRCLGAVCSSELAAHPPIL